MSRTKPTRHIVFAMASLRENVLCPDPGAALRYVPATLKGVQGKGVVAVDTNVLLLPYKLSKKVATRFELGLRELAQRKELFLPAHCAREYSLRHPIAVGELLAAVHNHRSRIPPQDLLSGPALEAMREYDTVRKAHKRMLDACSEYMSALEKLSSNLSTWSRNDPFRKLYSDCFPDSAIVAPSASDDDVLKDADYRMTSSRPPGYKDKSKENNWYGDVVVWHSILTLGKQTQKPVIFVTADEKADWFHQAMGQSITPRVELLLEFFSHTGGQHLVIVPPSDFFEALGADKTVIAEIRGAERGAQDFGKRTDIDDSTRQRYLTALTEDDVKAGCVITNAPPPLDLLVTVERDGKVLTRGMMLWSGFEVPESLAIELEQIKEIHNIAEITIYWLHHSGGGGTHRFNMTSAMWRSTHPTLRLASIATDMFFPYREHRAAMVRKGATT